MRIDQLLGDEQAQAQPACAVLVHDALESVEDAFLIARIDADAMVAHFDDGAVLRVRQADFHGLALAVAHGVADQVDNDLLDAEGIPKPLDRLEGHHFQHAARRRRIRCQVVRHPAYQAGQVDGYTADRQLAAGDARHIEHVVDQAHHAADLPPVARHHLVQLVRLEGGQVAPFEVDGAHLRFQEQRVQGRAQFVRHHGHEFVAQAQRTLQLSLGGA